MTRLSDLVATKEIFDARAADAKRSESMRERLERLARGEPGNPADVLFDLYRQDEYGRPKLSKSGDRFIYNDRVATMARDAIQALVPSVLRAIARQIGAEAVASQNEADAAALQLRAELGADWNAPLIEPEE